MYIPIMDQLMNIKMDNLLRLYKTFQKAPKKAAKASGLVLNTMAYQSRGFVQGYLQRNMIIRNQGLLKSSVIYNKNKVWNKIEGQYSEVGSRERERFSGWTEQITGQTAKRERTFSKYARTGSRRSGRVAKRFRTNQNFITPHDMEGSFSGDHQRAVALIMWTRRNKYRNPFLLYGHRTIEPGIFYWKGRKLRRLQHFKRFKAERLNWMKGSIAGYLAGVNMDRVWADAIDRIWKP